MTTPFPSFENPPVIEVVLGVQFEQLRSMAVTDIGKLHDVYAKDYPQVQEQAPLEPIFENMNAAQAFPNRLFFSFESMQQLPRVWFVSENGQTLLQFQRDRFIHNWRRDQPSPDQPYPRYEPIRDEFASRYGQFLEFLAANKKAPLEVNQVEVTYLNLIACDDDDFSKSLHRVFKFWKDECDGSPLWEPENQKFQTTYLLDFEGEKVGRLTISTNTLLRQDGKKFLQVNLTARGKPKDVGFDGVLRFMNHCRGTIVSGFDHLTTPEMQKIWGKK